MITKIRADFRTPFSLVIIFTLLITAALCLFACESPEVTESAKSPTGGTKGEILDSANLTISNHLTNDRGTLIFIRYPSEANDPLNAPGGIVLTKNQGKVGIDESVTFKVPIGTYRFVAKNESGIVFPMENDLGDWVKSTFEKNKSYQIIDSSNAQDKFWTTSYPTDPAMRRP